MKAPRSRCFRIVPSWLKWRSSYLEQFSCCDTRSGIREERRSLAESRVQNFLSGYTCRRTALLVACILALASFGQIRGAAEIVPAGTVLEIRLQQPISSYSTRKGTKISGVLIAPLAEGGKLLLPLGTTVEGSVVAVRKVGLGVVHETAQLTLVFDSIVLSDQKRIPLECRITEVENARESVDAKGRIQGIRSTATMSNRASGFAGTLAFGDPVAVIFATAASSSVLRFSEPEISLPKGTELLAKLTTPVEIPHSSMQIIPPLASSEEERAHLGGVVRDLPFRTYTDKTNIPSDITNLIFIGSAESLEHAFADAGWVQVDPLTAESTYSTVRSIAENQGYHAAPMSTLLLGGRPPAYAYAKTLNTFSKRHHLRIWSTTETWNGQTVWTSSSTHDIGIGFSRSKKTFIHLIDTNIDNERAKVVDDLIFTGCVSGVQLVSRPWIPKDAKNGTGEALVTDGRIAILHLNSCGEEKKELSESATVITVRGNRADRVTRQAVLTLKNNILRDNVGVMAYSGIRYVVNSKKHEGPQPVRTMEIEGAKYTIEEHPDYGTNYSFRRASIVEPQDESSPRLAHWRPPTVELGVHGAWTGYAGGNGGAFGLFFDSTNPPGDNVSVIMGNYLDSGWDIGGSVTIDSQRYLSQEFSFDYSTTKFIIGLSVLDNNTTTGSVDSAFAFSSSGLLTSQFAYNLLINARPVTSRWRPFLAVGPALQLMHLDDAPIKKAPSYFRLGLSNIGLISAAYNFGSTPPLEGGGIFQPGLNYGGGFRYRLTPRWMLRFDYRETLTSQPDFWTKSKADILSSLDYGDYTLTYLGPSLEGAMRTQRASGGISFTF